MLCLSPACEGRSVDTVRRSDVTAVTGATLAQTGLAPAPLAQQVCRRARLGGRALRSMPVRERLLRLEAAADAFVHHRLPAGGAEGLGLAAYVRLCSLAGGLPVAVVQESAVRLADHLRRLGRLLRAQSPDGTLEAYDSGLVRAGRGATFGWVPAVEAIAAIMPANNPMVHLHWLAAYASGLPCVVRPSLREPFTAERLVQALLAAGFPGDTVAFLPTAHGEVDLLVRQTGAALVFGGQTTIARFRHHPRVAVRGPGHSKTYIGPDWVTRPAALDIAVSAILDDAGRSCLNAHTVYVPPGYGSTVAAALATRLVPHGPLPLEREEARLPAFASRTEVQRLDALVEGCLAGGGAVDATAGLRPGPRHQRCADAWYMLPVIVHVDRPEHPLVGRELPFPFAAVVEADPAEVVPLLGDSLAVGCLTDDRRVLEAVLRSPTIDKVCIGRPTTRPSFPEPHRGFVTDDFFLKKAVTGLSSRPPGAEEGVVP